jgi:hypothetical protein
MNMNTTTTTQENTTMDKTAADYAFDRMKTTREYLFDHVDEALAIHASQIVYKFHEKTARLAREIKNTTDAGERELQNLQRGYMPNTLGVYWSSVTDANRIAAEIGQVHDEMIRFFHLIGEITESCDFNSDDLWNCAL